MENDNFKKGIKHLRKVDMTPAEKNVVLKNILNQVELEIFEVADNQVWYQSLSSFWLNRNVRVYALVLFFVVIGGSASFVAESSLPGDFLYPLKININEPLRSVIILDQVSKTDWEIQKINRRLEEIEAVTSRGDLDDDISKTIENNIDNNLRSFGNRVHRVDETDPKKASQAQFKIDTQVQAHKKIIDVYNEATGKKIFT